MPMPRNSRAAVAARWLRHNTNPTGNSKGGSGLSLAGPANVYMVEGVAYNSAVVASGGQSPYVYSIKSGVLPAAVTLDTNSGAITGTPDPGTAGEYPVTFQVDDQTPDLATVAEVFTVSAPGGDDTLASSDGMCSSDSVLASAG